MKAIQSSETSAFTRVTLRHTPEDGILYSYRRENLKSYIPFRFILWLFVGRYLRCMILLSAISNKTPVKRNVALRIRRSLRDFLYQITFASEEIYRIMLDR
jgi:hypothetical protein